MKFKISLSFFKKLKSFFAPKSFDKKFLFQRKFMIVMMGILLMAGAGFIFLKKEKIKNGVPLISGLSRTFFTFFEVLSF